jgi:hypothetical protein
MGGACTPMGEKRNVYNVLIGKPEERNHLEDIGTGRSMILK